MEHSDLNHALKSALVILAKQVTQVTELCAKEEAIGILNDISNNIDNTAWLVDRLTQMTIDYDTNLNMEL